MVLNKIRNIEVIGMNWVLVSGLYAGGVECLTIKQENSSVRINLLMGGCGNIARDQKAPVQNFLYWNESSLRNLIMCLVANKPNKNSTASIMYISNTVREEDASNNLIAYIDGQLVAVPLVIKHDEDGSIIFSHQKVEELEVNHDEDIMSLIKNYVELNNVDLEKFIDRVRDTVNSKVIKQHRNDHIVRNRRNQGTIEPILKFLDKLKDGIDFSNNTNTFVNEDRKYAFTKFCENMCN